MLNREWERFTLMGEDMFVTLILETIFRRPIRLLLLLLIPPLLGAGIVYFLPRTYQSSASLWALHRYIIIGATGPETDLQSTPAQTQVTALTELLQSRSFALKISKQAGLAATLSASTQADPQKLDDAMVADISQNVLPLAQGYNLFVVTYTNKDPKVAQAVVQAVITNFDLESQSISVEDAQHLLTSYQAQLTDAQHDQDAAVAAETAYLQENPTLSATNLQNDPKYQLLHSQTQQAQARVQNIQTTIDTLNQEISDQGSGSGSLFSVFDPPQISDHPVSRLKLLLTGGGAGLGLALLACALYILILVRRDHAMYRAVDLKKVTNLPVVMEMPCLSSKSLLLSPPATYK